MSKYIKSSPVFFRMIAISMALMFLAIAVLAAIFEAPLQEPAEPHNVPNPSKSAWFLLWMQEIVSYNLNFVYLIVLFFIGFLTAPFIIKTNDAAYAKWFDRRFFVMHIITLGVLTFIIVLTIIAYFFRVEYWQFGI